MRERERFKSRTSPQLSGEREREAVGLAEVGRCREGGRADRPAARALQSSVGRLDRVSRKGREIERGIERYLPGCQLAGFV